MEDRKAIYEAYTGEKAHYLERPFCLYDRYFEANLILNNLPSDIAKLNVLDFGCAVADYAITFARAGAKVFCFDKQFYLQFVTYRFSLENIEGTLYEVGVSDIKEVVGGKDLVIFGEVLEHLDNPLDTLQACIDASVRYIFTSSYPYQDNEAYWTKSGHSALAHQQQLPFRELISKYYSDKVLDGQGRLWTRKD